MTFSEDDTIGDLKKLIAAQTGTRSDKIVLKKWSVDASNDVQFSCAFVSWWFNSCNFYTPFRHQFSW